MSAQMNAQDFARLLKTHPEMLEDANRFTTLLRETYPNEKGNVNLMTAAHEAGVVSMLRSGSSGERLLTRIMIPLMDDYGITEERARWVAELWRDAYAAATEGTPATETHAAAPSLPETDPSCFKVEPNQQGCAITKYTGPNAGEVVIPAKLNGKPVTEIGLEAFRGSFGATSIIIPRGVTKIGERAFQSCHDLTSVTIPDSVTEIGDLAFCDCFDLADVTIPRSVTKIGMSAFQSCAMTSVIIPDSVTEIGGGAFQYSNLHKVTIPGSVAKIESGTFTNCGALTSVTILDGVTEIGKWVFEDCHSLTDVTLPGSVTKFGERAFNRCHFHLVFHAPAGSAAEKYAKEHHITFETI